MRKCIAFIGFLLIFSSFVHATTTISACQALTTQDETYILDSDIDNSDDTCFKVYNSGITLDLWGHYVDGTNNGQVKAGIYLYGNASYFTLKNGVIKQFRFNVYNPTAEADHIRIINMTLQESNGADISTSGAGGNLNWSIEDSTIGLGNATTNSYINMRVNQSLSISNTQIDCDGGGGTGFLVNGKFADYDMAITLDNLNISNCAEGISSTPYGNRINTITGNNVVLTNISDWDLEANTQAGYQPSVNIFKNIDTSQTNASLHMAGIAGGDFPNTVYIINCSDYNETLIEWDFVSQNFTVWEQYYHRARLIDDGGSGVQNNVITFRDNNYSLEDTLLTDASGYTDYTNLTLCHSNSSTPCYTHNDHTINFTGNATTMLATNDTTFTISYENGMLTSTLTTYSSNTAPTINDATIFPTLPTNHTYLRCDNGTVSDADSLASLTLYYKWWKNGVEQTGLAENKTLDYSNLGVGETWNCSIIANDGGLNSTEVYSNAVTIVAHDYIYVDPANFMLRNRTESSISGFGATVQQAPEWGQKLFIEEQNVSMWYRDAPEMKELGLNYVTVRMGWDMINFDGTQNSTKFGVVEQILDILGNNSMQVEIWFDASNAPRDGHYKDEVWSMSVNDTVQEVFLQDLANITGYFANRTEILGWRTENELLSTRSTDVYTGGRFFQGCWNTTGNPDCTQDWHAWLGNHSMTVADWNALHNASYGDVYSIPMPNLTITTTDPIAPLWLNFRENKTAELNYRIWNYTTQADPYHLTLVTQLTWKAYGKSYTGFQNWSLWDNYDILGGNQYPGQYDYFYPEEVSIVESSVIAPLKTTEKPIMVSEAGVGPGAIDDGVNDTNWIALVAVQSVLLNSTYTAYWTWGHTLYNETPTGARKPAYYALQRILKNASGHTYTMKDREPEVAIVMQNEFMGQPSGGWYARPTVQRLGMVLSQFHIPYEVIPSYNLTANFLNTKGYKLVIIPPMRQILLYDGVSTTWPYSWSALRAWVRDNADNVLVMSHFNTLDTWYKHYPPNAVMLEIMGYSSYTRHENTFSAGYHNITLNGTLGSMSAGDAVWFEANTSDKWNYYNYTNHNGNVSVIGLLDNDATKSFLAKHDYGGGTWGDVYLVGSYGSLWDSLADNQLPDYNALNNLTREFLADAGVSYDDTGHSFMWGMSNDETSFIAIKKFTDANDVMIANFSTSYPYFDKNQSVKNVFDDSAKPELEIHANSTFDLYKFTTAERVNMTVLTDSDDTNVTIWNWNTSYMDWDGQAPAGTWVNYTICGLTNDEYFDIKVSGLAYLASQKVIGGCINFSYSSWSDHNFTVERGSGNYAPYVFINSPITGYALNGSQDIDITFTVIDDNSTTTNCTLYSNRTGVVAVEAVNGSVANNTLTTFNMSMYDDDFNSPIQYNVTCLDGTTPNATGTNQSTFSRWECWNVTTDTTLTENTDNVVGSCFQILSSNVVFDCNGHTITNGLASGNLYSGIYFEQLDNVTIKNCIINRYMNGINANNSNSSLIFNNSIYINATTNDADGIFLNSNNGLNVMSNWVYNNSVFVNATTGQANGISAETEGAGLYLNHTHIENNTIRTNSTGSWSFGVRIFDQSNKAYGSYIAGNDIYSNSTKASANFYAAGIYLEEGKQSIVDQNTIHTEASVAWSSGIYLGSATADYNNITSNTVYTGNWSIYTDNAGADYNLVYGNNFTNNMRTFGGYAFDASGGGNWYNNSNTGNYWGDILNTSIRDSDADGRGDQYVPYNLTNGNVSAGIDDYHPLYSNQNFSASPYVYISSPIAGYALNGSQDINITFTVIDNNSTTTNCSLYSNRTGAWAFENGNASVANNTLTTLNMSFYDDDFNSPIQYNITCNDGDTPNNTGTNQSSMSRWECWNVSYDTTLTEDVTLQGTCFQFISNDIVFDCAGYTINQDIAIGNTGTGLYGTNLSNIEIKNCIIQNYAYGILFNNTNNSIVHDNYIYMNTTTPLAWGVTFATSVGQEQVNNSIYGNIIEGNDTNNGLIGVLIDNSGAYSNNTDIENNTITLDSSGAVSQCWGVYMGDSGVSRDSQVSGNTFYINSSLAGATWGSLGVYLYNVQDSLVQENTFYVEAPDATSVGIRITGADADRNNITMNTFYAGNYSMTIDNAGSCENTIWQNNFTNDQRTFGGFAHDSSTCNYWNLSTTGNYWGDILNTTINDTTGDGRGDQGTPYNLTQGNVSANIDDYHPLWAYYSTPGGGGGGGGGGLFTCYDGTEAGECSTVNIGFRCSWMLTLIEDETCSEEYEQICGDGICGLYENDPDSEFYCPADCERDFMEDIVEAIRSLLGQIWDWLMSLLGWKFDFEGITISISWLIILVLLIMATFMFVVRQVTAGLLLVLLALLISLCGVETLGLI